MGEGNWTQELLAEEEKRHPWRKRIKVVLIIFIVIMLGITVWKNIENQIYYHSFFYDDYRWFNGNAFTQEYKDGTSITIAHLDKNKNLLAMVANDKTFCVYQKRDREYIYTDYSEEEWYEYEDWMVSDIYALLEGAIQPEWGVFDYTKIKNVFYLGTIMNKDYVKVTYDYNGVNVKYKFAIDTNTHKILSADMSVLNLKTHLEYFQLDDSAVRIPRATETIGYRGVFSKISGLKDRELMPFQTFFDLLEQ